MNNVNGKVAVLDTDTATPLNNDTQGVIEYVTKYTGIKVWIRPISMRVWLAVNRKAVELYPDPKPPMKPIDTSEDKLAYAIEDITEEADTNDPVYKEALAEAREQQLKYRNRAIYGHYVEFPDYRPEQLVKRFADDIAFLRENGSDLPNDDYELAMFHCVFTTVDEVEIKKYLMDAIPVTSEETVEQLRIFRPEV